MMSKELFEQASEQVQLNCVREEAMSIALERYLLPEAYERRLKNLALSQSAEKKNLVHVADCYDRALYRVCTTLTKGWFREFAIDAWPLVQLSSFGSAEWLNSVCHQLMRQYQDGVDKAEAKRKQEIAEMEQKQRVIEERKQTMEHDYIGRRKMVLQAMFPDQKRQDWASDILHTAEYDIHHEDWLVTIPMWPECKTRVSCRMQFINTYLNDKGGWCDHYKRWRMSLGCGDVKRSFVKPLVKFDLDVFMDDSYPSGDKWVPVEANMWPVPLDACLVDVHYDLVQLMLLLVWPTRLQHGGQKFLAKYTKDVDYQLDVYMRMWTQELSKENREKVAEARKHLPKSITDIVRS